MSRIPKRNSPAALLKQLHGENPHERLLHRLHAVALVESGMPASAVGRIFGDSPRAVAYWATRYREGGISALRDEPRSGRPSKLTPEQQQGVRSFLRHRTLKGSSVTARDLSEFLAGEFGISFTMRHCQRLLSQLAS